MADTKTTERMRIAMLGHKHIPSREGGIEIVVEELATRMVGLGYEVTCFNRGGHHVSGKQFDEQELSEYKGIKLKTVPTIEKKGLAAVTSSFFASIYAIFGGYNVIHFHAEGPCAILWLPKLFGKKCVVTVHGLDWAREKWSGGFASKYIKFGERIAAKYADEIIVLSENVQKYFMDTYGRKTVFIPNGVNQPKNTKPELIKIKFGTANEEYFLYLARLVQEKGLRYLIQAFKQIKTDKKLLIAGGTSDTDEFVNEMKALAADDSRIVFTGFVQGQLLEELYSNAYVYVLPSDLEGMPLSLLEAMSYGNCCLTSDIPECASIVEDKAVIFEKGNVEDLRNKLQMLCDNPALVKGYQTGAAEFICGKYNWDDVVKQTIELYRDKT